MADETQIDAGLLEVLAYELALRFGELDTAGVDGEPARAQWRREVDIQAESREGARRLLAALEAAGIRVSVARKAAVRDRCLELVTQPARHVYDVPGVTDTEG